MTIRWITPLLGTAPALSVTTEENLNIIDVRDLVDKAGNLPDSILNKITAGCESLRAGHKTVICCDYGISRSNAIAVGIISIYQSISFEKAVRYVLDSTGEKEIKAEPLSAVRKALGKSNIYCHVKPHLLITGATGFIGQAVNLKLSTEYTVVTPTSKEVDLRCGSTQLDLLVGENEVDIILHLANPRVYTSNVALGESLTMLRNVMDVCISRDIKLIYLSSWEVYSGYRSTNLKADELLPLAPKGPYAETKYLCELLIEHSRRAQGLKCTMLRSSPVYGGGSDKPKFIFNFIDKIKSGLEVITHQYKNCFPSIDLLYIDDLVLAIYKTIQSDFIGNINVGTGVLTSTKVIAEKLNLKLLGNSDINFNHIDSYTACIAIDSTVAKTKIGWEPSINIDQGLELIISKVKIDK